MMLLNDPASKHCKKNVENELQNSSINFKSTQTIESMISLDDTILNCIEDVNSDDTSNQKETDIILNSEDKNSREMCVPIVDKKPKCNIIHVSHSLFNTNKNKRNFRRSFIEKDTTVCSNLAEIVNSGLKNKESDKSSNTSFDEASQFNFSTLGDSQFDYLDNCTFSSTFNKSNNKNMNSDQYLKNISVKQKSNHYENYKLDDNSYLLQKSAENQFYKLPPIVEKLIKKIKKIDKLYAWQDECLNLDAVRNRKNLIYALPTSGGKTLVAEILMLKEILCNKKNSIFILPFVALVQEKVQSMTPFALELGFVIEEYAASKGQYPPKKRRKKNSIYICTIEKALGLINSLIEINRLNEIGIIVVDELHLLGESGGRGATLEVTLTKVMKANENIHVIGMSATIGNLNEIAKFLNADLYIKNFRPISIKEYVKCENSIWLVDFKSEEILTDMKQINYRYSSDADLVDPDRIGGLVMDVIPQDACLVFCSSRKNCENVALLLSKVLFRSLLEHKKIEKNILIQAIKNEAACPILIKTIPFGVAYHHSGLTSEERRLLEDAFKEGVLCVICCTSTLAAGVNLPARRVILRSPFVGNEFLSLCRYKQMIGRAGRAGLGDIGESILICKQQDLFKVKQLLTSRMDDSLSTLHLEKDRGINDLILSSVFLSLARSRAELLALVDTTLCSIQKTRLNINLEKITDDAISELLKYRVLMVKKNNSKLEILKIIIPSQSRTPAIEYSTYEEKDKIENNTITLEDDTQLYLSDFGRAAIKGTIELQYAYKLYDDIKIAQKHLITSDKLHLLYLITPYNSTQQIKIVGTVYYNEVTNLTENQMKIARLLGINEVAISRIRNNIMPKNVDPRVIERFYVTLIIRDLLSQYSNNEVAEKYQINRGTIQNLLNSVATFGFSVTRFCNELKEFWAFADLLPPFCKRIIYCCPPELEDLMDLPFVKIARARQLFNAGYKTLRSIAKADPQKMQRDIEYLSYNTVKQIISAANLLLMQKIQDLKDEADDILDGEDVNIFF